MDNERGKNALSVTALLAEFAQVIATWPLYREFKYNAKHIERAVEFPGQAAHYALLPQTLTLFCDNGMCQKQQLWELSGRQEQESVVYFGGDPKEVRILWIAPASEAKGEHNFQPEDARAQQVSRYIGNWRLDDTSTEAATLKSDFDFPQSGRELLASPTPESAWSKEPWAHDKAYLVFLIKDENVEQNNQRVGDQLLGGKTTSSAGEVSFTPSASLTAVVNGVPKALHPFKTLRTQERGKTRCYFASLDSETRAGAKNHVSVTLPVERGLVFAGAYLDLPDQMPDGQ